MSAPLRIASRCCGPPQSGNGGYTCGLLAEASGLPGAVEFTLKAPPPLGRMTAVFDQRPQAGQTLIVVARSGGRDGRKVFAQTAVYAEDSQRLGHSAQTWISLQRPVTG